MLKILKKIGVIGLFVVLGIVILNVLIYCLLLIPSVQQRVLQFALDKIRTKIKTEVSIDRIQLRLFNHVELQGVYLEDKKGDTLLYAKEFSTDIDAWKLLRNQVLIKNISLTDFALNIHRKDSASAYNYQFLIDAFASSDTTKKKSGEPMQVSMERVKLRKGRLSYETLSDPRTPDLFNVSHIVLSGVNADLSLPSVESTRLDIRVDNFAAHDISGLNLLKSSLRLTSKGSLFLVENARLHLGGSDIDIPSAGYDVLQQTVNAQINKSVISPKDIAYFAQQMKSLKDSIFLNGKIRGKLPSITVDGLNLNYGKKIALIASGELTNYSRYFTSRMRLDVKKFRMTQAGFLDLMRMNNSRYKMPEQMKAVGDIRLKAFADGSLQKMNLKADVWMRPGALSLNGRMTLDSTFNKLGVKGNILTQNFNLKPFGGNSLGRVTAGADIAYMQTRPGVFTAKAAGTVNSIEYQKEKYKNIRFAVNYSPQQTNGTLNADMKQGRILADFKMIQGARPVYAFKGSVQHLHINSFYRYEKWNNPFLSANLEGNISGNSKSGFSGYAQMENLDFADGDTHFTPGLIRFSAGKNGNKTDFMELSSSFLDARVDGVIDPGSLVDELCHVVHRYLPQFVLTSGRRLPNANNFTFTAKTKDTKQLESIFRIPVSLTSPVSLDGSVNTREQALTLTGSAPLLKYNNGDIKDMTLNVSTANHQLNMDAHAQYFDDAKGSRMELYTKANALSDTIRSQINYSNETPDMSVGGQLDSYAFFSRNKKKELISHLHVEPSMIYVNDLRFLLTPAQIVNVGRRTDISDLGLKVEGKNYIRINGTVSDSSSDTLRVDFQKAQLAELLSAFDIKNIDAVLDGSLHIASAMNLPEIYTDGFKMNNIVVSGDSVGSVDLVSKWRSESQAVDLAAKLERNNKQLAHVTGLVYTGDSLRLDLNVAMDKMTMDWMQPFTAGSLSTLKGELSSNISVKGPAANPDIEGWLGIANGVFGVDYTNVTYKVSDTISISRNKIGFDNLTVVDPSGNKAYVNADVTHSGFKNFRYTLNARMNNFMVMNTENRTDSLYYGKVYASGNARLTGDTQGMNIQLDIRNANNSNFTVVMPQTESAVQYKGVVFINTPSEINTDSLERSHPVRTVPVRNNDSPFKMQVQGTANLSDNLRLNIIMAQLTGNTTMRVAGTGQIKFAYDNTTAQTTIFGNYNVTQGTVKLDLQQISNMEFQIQEGSSLVFRGDPMRTTFDITAYKEVKADLKTLDESFSTDQNLTSTRADVHCILGIKGDMNKMNLSYNIDLPDANEDIKSKLRALIATDEQKTQQFVYLIFTNSFYNSAGTNSVASNLGVNNVMTSVASGALSKAFDSLFGKILGDKWNIDTNVSSNDGTISNMDVNVNVSTRLFNDKLRVKTNLGYRSGSELTGTSESLVGNVDVEYLLNNYLTLRVYNKENNKYYIQSTMTQGVGIVYTRDSKRFRDLFRFFRKKKTPPTSIPQENNVSGTK